MKLRDKVLYMSYGAGLVVLGMILNSLIGDVDAQVGVKDVEFGFITCKGLIIKDRNKKRGSFDLDPNDNAALRIYGDDEKSILAYLGGNAEDENHEMIFQLQSKSKIDKRQVMMMIGENGGRFDSLNKIGESINSLEVGSGGSLDVRVKYENKK